MANKGRNGQGTFRRTKCGSIEYRLPYYDENDIRRTKSFTADSEEACLERADEFIRELSMKLIIIEPDATIPDIMKQKVYNDYVKNYTGEQGYDRNLYTIRIIEEGPIGKIPIADISEDMLLSFLEQIRHYSNTVVRKIFSMVSAAYKMVSDAPSQKDRIKRSEA